MQTIEETTQEKYERLTAELDEIKTASQVFRTVGRKLDRDTAGALARVLESVQLPHAARAVRRGHEMG
jgi:hypothetical protein